KILSPFPFSKWQHLSLSFVLSFFFLPLFFRRNSSFFFFLSYFTERFASFLPLLSSSFFSPFLFSESFFFFFLLGYLFVSLSLSDLSLDCLLLLGAKSSVLLFLLSLSLLLFFSTPVLASSFSFEF
ncbi:hypothetical protein CSUI_007810, partial [Cystoisospora suis]